MKILVTILLPVVILLMLESCARTIVTLRSDVAVRVEAVLPETVASAELGWDRLPNFAGRLRHDFTSAERRYDAHGFQAYDTAQIADKDTPRIVTIGDSNTYGWGVRPEDAFAEVLDRALPNASVINLGMLGYSSFQGYRTLLKYGEQLQPAAIVASFNRNDRKYVLNGNIDSEQKFSHYAEGQQKASRYEWLNRIYMVRLLRSVMRRIGLVQPEPLLNTHINSLVARVPPERYRENLRKIAEYGRSRKIPVIFLLLKDNPLYSAQLRAGIAFRQDGQYEKAVRAFSIALSHRGYDRLARKYLVQTYQSMGQHAKAAALEHIDAEPDNMDGAYPIYLDTDYNEIMVEVAREFGIKLVDARPMLDAMPEVFIDINHPDEVGHARIAEMLLKALEEVAPALAKGALKPIGDRMADHVRLKS